MIPLPTLHLSPLLSTPQVAEAAAEMVAGVRDYFDQGLRHFLLYSHEVPQADAALAPPSSSDAAAAAAALASPAPKGKGKGGKGRKRKKGEAAAEEGGGGGAEQQAEDAGPAPSDLYGAEHLVRLFVKLPELVPVAYMTPPVSGVWFMSAWRCVAAGGGRGSAARRAA